VAAARSPRLQRRRLHSAVSGGARRAAPLPTVRLPSQQPSSQSDITRGDSGGGPMAIDMEFMDSQP
jgi:hypothetical protein